MKLTESYIGKYAHSVLFYNTFGLIIYETNDSFTILTSSGIVLTDYWLYFKIITREDCEIIFKRNFKSLI